MKGEINMNMFDITKEIRAILLESEIISLLIGDRVFPLMAPENTIGDYIVYQRDGYKQEYTKMGVASHYPVVFVTAVSEDYDRSNQLASAIYDTLSGSFSDPDIRIELEDSTEDFIDKKYIQVLEFTIKQR
jgi:hypothetical protein